MSYSTSQISPKNTRRVELADLKHTDAKPSLEEYTQALSPCHPALSLEVSDEGREWHSEFKQ